MMFIRRFTDKKLSTYIRTSQFGNISGIVTPIAIGYIVGTTGSFNGALIYVGVHALVAIISYLVLVGDIKRIELKPVAGQLS